MNKTEYKAAILNTASNVALHYAMPREFNAERYMEGQKRLFEAAIRKGRNLPESTK